MRPSIHRALALLALFSTLLLPACSDITEPGSSSPDEGIVVFDGNMQPSDSTFLLKRVEQPGPDGQVLPIELIGSNLKIDAAEENISVDVALRNPTRRNYYPPAFIHLGRFNPPTVTVINSDDSIFMDPALADSGGVDMPMIGYLFDYSDRFGDDGVLEGGETSEPRTWIFHSPGLTAFSFEATAFFGVNPARPFIGGLIFTDVNGNGQIDAGEPPFPAGFVRLERPDSSIELVDVGQDGRYEAPVKEPGLHRVTYIPPPTFGFVPLCFTTPNPLEVLLPPGPEGRLQSFEHADFGIDDDPCIFRFVVLTGRDPATIPQSFYRLLGIELGNNDLLHLKVGFSGCSPDHPFTLYAGDSFMESNPVQTWVLLAHDDLGQMCDAYFERQLVFDLRPIRELHRQQYGTEGPIGLRFTDFEGTVHELLMP